MEDKKIKKRWKLEVIPWLIRMVGLYTIYYLITIKSPWFIPILAISAHGIGRWLRMKINRLREITDGDSE